MNLSQDIVLTPWLPIAISITLNGNEEKNFIFSDLDEAIDFRAREAVTEIQILSAMARYEIKEILSPKIYFKLPVGANAD